MSSAGQRRGACGHLMAIFDTHQRCARCRESSKGDDACVLGQHCDICLAFTPQQVEQLAKPKYRERQQEKKRREKKILPMAREHVPEEEDVVIASHPQDGAHNIPQACASPIRDKSASKKQRGHRATPLSMDTLEARLETYDTKLSDRLNKLEALILATSFTPDASVPVPSSVRPAPVSERPFFEPLPSIASVSACPKDLEDKEDNAPVRQLISVKEETVPGQLDSYIPGWSLEGFSPVESTREEEPASEPQEQNSLDIDSAPIENLGDEENYRETLQGVRSFMGWSDIPEFEKVSGNENNPFAASRQHPVGKVSVCMPADKWLCKKMDGLNLTLTSGYRSVATKSTPLAKDQFLKLSSNVSNWYDMHQPQGSSDNTGTSSPNQKTVTFWCNQAACVNTGFPLIANTAISHSPPSSRPISQEILQQWERSAKNSTYICNQAAGLSRCLTKLHDSMAAQFKVIQTMPSNHPDYAQAMDELSYLLCFNDSVTATMKRSVQDLTDTTFTNMANIILLRRDSYLDHLKLGVQPDTAAALRSAPLQSDTLFSDSLVAKAEQEVKDYENCGASSSRHNRPSHPYWAPQSGSHKKQQQEKPAWKQLADRKRASKSPFDN